MYIIRKDTTPEDIMKQMFHNFFEVQKGLRVATTLYTRRNSFDKADPENVVNIAKATNLLNLAYDELSAIWENDINV